MDFDGKVVLVTGASRGLGKAFAACIAEAGAIVVVNSTGQTNDGDAVVEQIISTGGKAIHIPERVENAHNLVDAVHNECGQLDAIVHNAGFIQDKTLRKMSLEQWNDVMQVHLTSAFLLSQAAWPLFEKHGGGRLVFLSSSAGLYGNFGQGNYAAAKIGMYGLCRTISLEGAAANIHCNCVAPFGATQMNSANIPDPLKEVVKAEYVAPLIGYLAHPQCSENGGLFEASAGCFKKVRWERSAGLRLDPNKQMSIDDVAAGWQQVIDFSSSEHPENMREALQGLYQTS